ncbi:hypothetical protein [Shewanella sp. UCD-KL21]|uniref:hypothetical protein n=1 Tax=Shewanella sp. UCD-KL21 TaxID=1917164 RepID=UPI0009713010|nr:hypothetical protein [Shewanella sp. UCD-KL21]
MTQGSITARLATTEASKTRHKLPSTTIAKPASLVPVTLSSSILSPSILSSATNQASTASSSSVPQLSHDTKSHVAVTFTIANKTFQFSASHQIQQILHSGGQLMLSNDTLKQLTKLTGSASHKQATPSSLTNKQLVLVAAAIQTKLPIELLTLAKSNNISPQQLMALAARAQGYPLPVVEIKHNHMRFESGVEITVSASAKLPQGQHLAHISLVAGKPLLTLTPILHVTTADLFAIDTNNQNNNKSTNNNQLQANSEHVVVRKDEPAQLLRQLLNKLEQIPLTASVETAVTNVKPPQQQANSHQHSASATVAQVNTKSPVEVLKQNLHKAGAMPLKNTYSNNATNSLASALLALLPSLNPRPLSQLADQSLLKQELLSLTNLNLTNTQQLPNTALTAGAISALFQLLIGFKRQGAHTQLSPSLQHYLDKLQQKVLNITEQSQLLLSALDKARGVESLGKLATSFSGYQQASSDANQHLTWYIALPYSIGPRKEQLEGKFERGASNDKSATTSWRLQLKFNLTQGALLINAHKIGDFLDIKFTGENQSLLDKVSDFQALLSIKINQAGFVAREFTTVIDNVPATLLPGDHYLVKTNA